MKNYSGKAKVKEDSDFIYAGKTLDIIGVYTEYRNGSGAGCYADGTREYKLSLLGTEFEFDGKYTQTLAVIHDSHLEIIELNETVVLPLTKQETLQLIEYCKSENVSCSYNETLENFIQENTKPSVLPIPDLSTLYSDEEWDKLNN